MLTAGRDDEPPGQLEYPPAGAQGSDRESVDIEIADAVISAVAAAGEPNSYNNVRHMGANPASGTGEVALDGAAISSGGTDSVASGGTTAGTAGLRVTAVCDATVLTECKRVDICQFPPSLHVSPTSLSQHVPSPSLSHVSPASRPPLVEQLNSSLKQPPGSRLSQPLDHSHSDVWQAYPLLQSPEITARRDERSTSRTNDSVESTDQCRKSNNFIHDNTVCADHKNSKLFNFLASPAIMHDSEDNLFCNLQEDYMPHLEEDCVRSDDNDRDPGIGTGSIFLKTIKSFASGDVQCVRQSNSLGNAISSDILSAPNQFQDIALEQSCAGACSAALCVGRPRRSIGSTQCAHLMCTSPGSEGIAAVTTNVPSNSIKTSTFSRTHESPMHLHSYADNGLITRQVCTPTPNESVTDDNNVPSRSEEILAGASSRVLCTINSASMNDAHNDESVNRCDKYCDDYLQNCKTLKDSSFLNKELTEDPMLAGHSHLGCDIPKLMQCEGNTSSDRTTLNSTSSQSLELIPSQMQVPALNITDNNGRCNSTSGPIQSISSSDPSQHLITGAPALNNCCIEKLDDSDSADVGSCEDRVVRTLQLSRSCCTERNMGVSLSTTSIDRVTTCTDSLTISSITCTDSLTTSSTTCTDSLTTSSTNCTDSLTTSSTTCTDSLTTSSTTSAVTSATAVEGNVVTMVSTVVNNIQQVSLVHFSISHDTFKYLVIP